ncbi:MAG: serine hydrolase domain-containing protein [Pseudomonadales bacterium]
MHKRRKILLGLGATTLAVGAFAIHYLGSMARVGVGYMVKVTCSEVLVAGRSEQDVLATNFAGINPLLQFIDLTVDIAAVRVEGDLWGLGASTAVHRESVGCTLLSEQRLAPAAAPAANPAPAYRVALNQQVQNALVGLFNEAAGERPIGTRGSVVIQNGTVVAEQYAPGFNASTRQQSWSLAKGFTQALTGIATDKGLVTLAETALLPQWQSPDPRAAISLGHLLHMASGLQFTENYADPFSDVDQMLYNHANMGAFAASLPLRAKPGAESIYSSGTTNIVSHILRDRLERSGLDYHAMPRQWLFDPIGMSSAIFEVDAAGNFIGSSYIYATPRDFARFGQLYLQDGTWNGNRVLPKGWVDYTREPAIGVRNDYGSHWSLNLDQSNLPGLPADTFYLGGNDGQYIFVIPSKNAVIVRFGITRLPATFKQDVLPHIEAIYQAL